MIHEIVKLNGFNIRDDKARYYKNIEEMKTIIDLQEGDIIKTLGYYSQNDDGAATYLIRAKTEDDVIDNGHLHEINSLLVAELIVLDNKITAKQFGAIEDGETDDSTSIQNALKYASKYKVPLYLSKDKTYYVNKILTLYRNTTFDLNGSSIQCGCEQLFYNFERTDTYTAYNGNGNITVKNGKIYNASASFIHGQNIIIESIKFYNCDKDHFIEINACNNFKVLNCDFTGMKTQSADRNYVECIQIDSCGNWSGFSHFYDENNPTFDDTINQNITIDNCSFTPNTGNSKYNNLYVPIGSHGYPADKTKVHKKIKITNCTLHSFSYTGIRLMNVEDVTIENNNLFNCTNYGITFDGKCSRLRVENNEFLDIKGINIATLNTEKSHQNNYLFIRRNKFIYWEQITCISINYGIHVWIQENTVNSFNTNTKIAHLIDTGNVHLSGNNAGNSNGVKNNRVTIEGSTSFFKCDEYINLFAGSTTGDITLNHNITLFNEIFCGSGTVADSTFAQADLKCWQDNKNFAVNDILTFNNGTHKQILKVTANNKVNISASGTVYPIRGIYGRKI